MAEILLEPSSLSKIIPLSFDLNDTNASNAAQLMTKRQFNTADTDAWFQISLDDFVDTAGSFDITLFNLNDKSVFNHTGKPFTTNPFYYKLDSESDETTNEIRHAGRWIGQIVVTLANGDSATRKFIFDIEGHILDGQDAQVILLSDYQALINTINLAKDDLAQYNIDYSALIADVTTAEGVREQAEIDRAAVFAALVESEMVAQNVATKLTEKEATFAPRMLSLESELAETTNYEYLERFQRISPEVDDSGRFQRAVDSLPNGGTIALAGKDYYISGVTITKPINIIGVGTSKTNLINSGTGLMLSYDYSTLSDAGKRRPIQISDIGFYDSAAGSGTGISLKNILNLELNRLFFNNFSLGSTPGYAVLATTYTMCVTLNHIDTQASEIRFQGTWNNVINIKGGEYRNVATYGLYVKNSTVASIRNLVVEDYVDTPVSGIFLENVSHLIIDNLYVESLAGVSDAGLRMINCRKVKIEGSTITTTGSGRTSIYVTGGEDINIDLSTLYEIIKVDGETKNINFNQNNCFSTFDIADGVIHKINNCTPLASMIFPINPKFQSEKGSSKLLLTNLANDSSMENGAPFSQNLVGSAIATHDTTQGYYDNKSLKIVGVNGDIRSILPSSIASPTTGGVIFAFMAKVETPGIFDFTFTIGSSAGAGKTHITNDWRRFFAITTMGKLPGTIRLNAEFKSSNTLWIDDIHIIPVTSYKEAEKYIGNYRYVWTHGEIITSDSRYTKPIKTFFEVGTNYRVTKMAPNLPTPGDVVYADGVAWNPGSGEGIYRYNIAGVWVFIG